MKLYAEVAIPPLAGQFLYSIPENLIDMVEIGQQVQVYLGKRIESGFITSFKNSTDFNSEKIKPLYRIASEVPYFTERSLAFYSWVAAYYAENLSNVIDTAVPAQTNKKYVTFAKLKDQSQLITGKTQVKIVEYLAARLSNHSEEEISLRTIINLFPNCGSSLKNLKEKRIIEYVYREARSYHETLEPKSWTKKQVTLNQQQSAAYSIVKDRIDEKLFQAISLHGVTGSGKTEVYIESCLYALEKGLSSLIIVPEIALTPQLVDRFTARFGPVISVLHSGLEKRNRWDSWLSLLKGETKIAIGARSAVFAPIDNLGIIIVDEEHDSSYKQADGFRYNGRDMAIARAKLDNIPIILGSATPSLETFYNSINKKYLYVRLDSKYSESRLPDTSIINLNNYKPWEMATKNISPVLKDQLTSCLEKKQQSFILYNRRGFSIFIQCEKCGYIANCPRCSICLSYHKNSDSLVCHLCGVSQKVPVVCPECKKQDKKVVESKFSQRGAGTERVFDEIRQLFPEAKVERLDRDSVSGEKDYREILDRMREGKTDILVGTQMIAKGHDIENVTLVGIIDCDVGLSFPDFRAGERAFQLLTQVAGRAGRGDKPGTVIFQTRLPGNQSIQSASKGDFFTFAKTELAERKSLNYPPFSRLLRIVALSQSQIDGLARLEEIKKELKIFLQGKNDAVIMGPVSASIQKIKNKYRHHLMIKSVTHSALHKILKHLKLNIKKKKDIKLIYDLDPLDML